VDEEKNKSNELKVDVNPENTPILYTDTIFMSANEDGVVLDVCQRIGTSNQAKVVSRVGMSKSHAKKFLKSLTDLLTSSEGAVQTRKKIEV
jgi:hypothetical protein